LENFEDQFAPEHVVPGVTVLLNLSPDLPQRERGFFEMGTRLVISRITYRLLRSLKDPDTVEAAVDVILPQLTTLSSKMSLIHQVGYREGAGHKLVSETAATRFEKAWRGEVLSAPVQALAREPELRWILVFAKQVADPSDPPFIIDESPELTLALLQGYKSETLTQTMGNRAVQKSQRLAWNSLIDLYGDETTLRERVEAARAISTHEADDLFELADKYFEGWRPDN
jgi:hypothetical protein